MESMNDQAFRTGCNDVVKFIRTIGLVGGNWSAKIGGNTQASLRATLVYNDNYMNNRHGPCSFARGAFEGQGANCDMFSAISWLLLRHYTNLFFPAQAHDFTVIRGFIKGHSICLAVNQKLSEIKHGWNNSVMVEIRDKKRVEGVYDWRYDVNDESKKVLTIGLSKMKDLAKYFHQNTTILAVDPWVGYNYKHAIELSDYKFNDCPFFSLNLIKPPFIESCIKPPSVKQNSSMNLNDMIKHSGSAILKHNKELFYDETGAKTIRAKKEKCYNQPPLLIGKENKKQTQAGFKFKWNGSKMQFIKLQDERDFFLGATERVNLEYYLTNRSYRISTDDMELTDDECKKVTKIADVAIHYRRRNMQVFNGNVNLRIWDQDQLASLENEFFITFQNFLSLIRKKRYFHGYPRRTSRFRTYTDYEQYALEMYYCLIRYTLQCKY